MLMEGNKILEKDMILKDTYRILRKLGGGGEGTVWLAMHEPTCRLRAVKEIPKSGGSLSKREAETLKQLSHPGLPSLLDVTEDPQSWYLVMEYIPGRTLEQILEEEGAQESAG